MQLPEHKCGLYLEHNVYRDYYDSIEKGVLKIDEDWSDAWISAAERKNALLTESIWTLQWYPRTPVGFHMVAASTLEAVLEAAKRLS